MSRCRGKYCTWTRMSIDCGPYEDRRCLQGAMLDSELCMDIKRHFFHAAGCKRREWPEEVATYRRRHVEGGIATALPQAAETIRRREWWPAVLLRHGDSDSTAGHSCPVWHSSLTAAHADEGALESLQRRAMQVIFQDDDYVHDVAHQSRTRNAGVTTSPADRALLPAQCPTGDIISAGTVCYRTSVVPLSRVDCMRHPRNFETLKSRNVKFQHSFIP